jgi:hypothetical protein
MGAAVYTLGQERSQQSVCSECGRIINVLERYSRHTGHWGYERDERERDLASYHLCADCLSVTDSFFCDGFAFEHIWGHLEAHIHEFGGEISSACIVPLTPAARARVCDIIEAYWRYLDEEAA